MNIVACVTANSNSCVSCSFGVSVTGTCTSDSISTINVSSFNGNLNLVTGGAQQYVLSSTTSLGLTCTITYRLTVRGGTNISLITLSGNTITFAASDVLSDAETYYLDVEAQISPQTTWSAIFTGTFKYVDPCLTATMPASPTCPAEFTVNLGETKKSSTFAPFLDSVTTSVNNGTIICT